jgi:DNA mismatch repair protein MutS2
MVDRTLAYLDYTKLLEILQQYSATPFSPQLFSSLKPLADRAVITERQDRIDAMLAVLRWDGKLPLAGVPDVRNILKRSKVRDVLLEPKELSAIALFLQCCSDVQGFLKNAHVRLSFVEASSQVLDPLPSVSGRITKTINAEGFVEDTASYELSKIRSDLFIVRGKIRRHLESVMERETIRPILQDDYIAIRNGRYVIPMKPNFNQAIQGIVHDYSHSLKTSFVEPVEVVELNNAANILENEEAEEEKRILAELTAFVGAQTPVMTGNIEVLAEVDLYQSLALFSEAFQCVRPEIVAGGDVEVREARNPFIVLSRGDKTVPIDIFLQSEKKAMIISGPNAGGKTAALKTMGLVCAMALTGLFVPAGEKPRIPLFSGIRAVIGDEQDITLELSSFTAHITAIKELYEKALGGELILIDEIGGSTEPQEASALAMGIIDAFVEKDCRVVVTTHFNLLKAYGYRNSLAINVATTFDEKRMEPLYRLLYGVAGYSNALSVAQNIAVPAGIIEKSRSYLGTQESMLNDLIVTLENEKLLYEKEREELSRMRDEVEKQRMVLRERREELISRFQERLSGRLTGIDEEIEEIKKEIARKEKDAIRIAKGKLNHLKKRYRIAPDERDRELELGDYVHVSTLGSYGYITAVDREKQVYEIASGNIRTKVPRRNIEKKTLAPSSNGERPIQVVVERLSEAELNVMGFRVDEALQELERFIDRAILQGFERIKVRHGVGTGRLMNAIKGHLEALDYIKEFHSDEKNVGVTIVDFR